MAPLATPTTASDAPARALLMLAALVVSVVAAVDVAGLIPSVLLAVAGVLAFTAVVSTRLLRQGTWPSLLRICSFALVGFGLLWSGAWMAIAMGEVGTPPWALTAVGYIVVGSVAVLLQATRFRGWAFWVFLALHMALMIVVLNVLAARIDVFVFQDEGINGLLHGHNPYAMTFTNPFTQSESASIFGPGLVEHGRLDFGFPYLPTSLLTGIPGFLVGDVRYSQLIAMVVLAAAMRRMASDDTGRLLAFTAFAGPTCVLVTILSWVEPVILMLLALFLLAQRGRRPLGAALSLGLLLASKQYVVVLLPLLSHARRLIGTRATVLAVLTACAVAAPFFAAGPDAFWKSVVVLQLTQPIRPDSISLLTWSVGTFGWPPPAVYGVLPLAGGLATSTILAWRTRATPTVFVVGVALSLLVTCLLSKQAFLNYYLLVGGALVLGVLTWPHHMAEVEGAAAPVDQGEVVVPR